MAKKPAKKPHKQRPKGPGAKQELAALADDVPAAECLGTVR